MKVPGFLRRREVLAVLGMVFMADIVSGIVSPTFSLYASSLGASLVLIGILSAVVGLTRIISSVPTGVLADRVGRKNVLSVGMLFFAAMSLMYSVAPSPALLFPARVLAGLAMSATFFVGVAYLGDLVSARDRGFAIGLYTTVMGLGFAAGPSLAGIIVEAAGYRASYRAAAGFALVGFALARFGVVDTVSRCDSLDSEQPVDEGSAQLWTSGLRTVMKEPKLLAASLANMVMSTVFGGAVVNFLPLYAVSLSMGEETIGYLFSLRAVASTVMRLPTGLLTEECSSLRLMVAGLLLAAAVMFALSVSTSLWTLAACLAVEGATFGLFFTAGQAFVIEQSQEFNRGAALGLYGMAGSFGSTASPLLFGFVAHRFGFGMVFQVTAMTVLFGLAFLAYVSARQRHGHDRRLI